MSARETRCDEIGDEASIDSENNSEGTRAEFPSLPAPVIPSLQHGIETRQPVQPSQQTSIATALSTPQNVSYPPPVYVLPPYSGQFFPFQYGMPPYGFMTFQAQQLPHSLRQIAPKLQGDSSQTNTSRFSSRPPNFIETVKKIRKQLYDRSGVDELQEPPSEGEVYSKWRKSVFQEWKPHNMSHYLMVAKLSNRCFRLVIQIPERLNLRVTQSDFIDLYGKSEEKQFELLCDLLAGRVAFQDLKRRRRVKPEATQKETAQKASDGNTKELKEEIARLQSQNTDLQTKLEQAIEERDERKMREDNFRRRITILERENEEEFQQFRRDVDLLVEEKNELGESFLSHQIESGRQSPGSFTISEESSPASPSHEARRAEIQQKALERKEVELQRLRQQLSEMESSKESSIMQTIERNSARQQQAIRQHVKGEQKSPQPLRIKLIAPPSSNLKSSPGQPQSGRVVSRNILVSNNAKSPLILSRNQQQQQPSVKVVKVYSSLPASSQSQTVSKPLVQIVPSHQQQGTRVGDLSAPKVVSVQSLQQGQLNQGKPIRIETTTPSQQRVTVQNLVLSSGHKVHLQTPVSQSGSPSSFQVRALPIQPSQQQKQQQSTGAVTLQTTPASHNQLPQQINTALRSPALPPSYKPLESLQEVNRQATQASVVSPVSAVIPEVKAPTKQSPTELRNQVTMQDRYRYIAPTPQMLVASMSASSGAAGSVTQPAQTSAVQPTVTVGAQPVAPTANQVLQAHIKQEPKPAVPVSPLPPAGPNIQISQVHSGAPAVAASTGLTVKVKTEKVDRPLVNGIKRAHDSDDDVIEQPVAQKPRVEKEVIIIDSPPPAPTPEEKPVEQIPNDKELAIEGVDNDLIIKLGKLSKEEQWIKLAQSAQQLRNLRDNVCKLLRVLVPEIELGDKAEIMDDTTVDNLLKQVLEANVNPDATGS